MDDSSTANAFKTDSRIPLGMSSFGPKDQQAFGRNIRLAMACIEGSEEPANVKAIPSDEHTLRMRLRTLAKEMSSSQADLLELLVRFDEVQGWKSGGAKHCAAWMNTQIGIGMKLGWEYLRAGRKLRELPTTRALFRAGQLSWSKIRAIVRVADSDNEKILCHAALDASVTEVERLCGEYRWKKDKQGISESERALKQWASRSLTWKDASDGSTRISLNLPPAIARAFLNSIEHSLSQMGESDAMISQRRADAAVLMAESSLQAAGRDFATADRYQVIVSVDANELITSSCDETSNENTTPSKRPTVNGAGPIAHETARRIACDCSVTSNTTTNGELTHIGRKSRIWPTAMARAIKERDQHCQFNGCSQTKNLQIHHIHHWADGGSTSVCNGVSICQSCHTLLHEGGYRIQRVDNDAQRVNEQFEQQRNTGDNSQFDFEKNLRNDRKSFDTVRTLLPTRYRFRVVDAQGRDIRSRCDGSTAYATVTANYNDTGRNPSAGTGTGNSNHTHTYTRTNTETNSTTSYSLKQSTHIDCAEPTPGFYCFSKTSDSRCALWFTAEKIVAYHVTKIPLSVRHLR